jgi:hypothetical protein
MPSGRGIFDRDGRRCVRILGWWVVARVAISTVSPGGAEQTGATWSRPFVQLGAAS